VLHIIDGLGGGGSERLLWDITRLSDREQIMHRVITVYPDDGSFVYAERMRQEGFYRRPEHDPKAIIASSEWNSPEAWERRLSAQRKRSLTSVLAGRLSHTLLRRASSSDRATDNVLTDEETGYPLNDERPRNLFESVMPDAAQRSLKEYLRFRPHVIQGHTFQGFGLGLFLKMTFRRPLVYFVPCLFSQLVDAGVAYLPNLYQQFHHGVDRFITGYPEELLWVGVPADKIVPVSQSLDLQEVEAVLKERERHRTAVRELIGVQRDAVIALSVGRLHPSKGHEYALESMPFLQRHFANLHWILIGKTSEEERAALETRAKDLGVQANVHIMGFVEGPLPFYAAADIYFRTVLFEADNLSSCQAMAMGVPVVGFETGASTELIDKVGHGILVPIRDAEALAEAARRVLSLADRGRAMGNRGAEYCRAHLDIQKFVNQLTSVYSELRRNDGR
jgi:glycosyltransferase involved in cell wall biosynthesis